MPDPLKALAPGAVIGILGSGQLGRMLALAAADLGFDVHIFSPDAGSPAGRVAVKEVVGKYSDRAAIERFAIPCDVITYEFENVPVETVQWIEQLSKRVRPGSKPLETTQDRLQEKTFLNNLGIQTAPFYSVDSIEDLKNALVATGGEGFLKTRRDGYDGKGQIRIKSADQVDEAYMVMVGTPCILEGIAPFEAELSVVIARTVTGELRAYEPSRNDHTDGILRASVVPGGFSDTTVRKATEMAGRIATAFDYVGILAVEFFLMPDGTLWVNEIAPRVHNTGHWTPALAFTGQFEQHIRAVLSWPLGDVSRHSDGKMENILGEELNDWPDFSNRHGELRIYGKREWTAGRKVAHFTTIKPKSTGD